MFLSCLYIYDSVDKHCNSLFKTLPEERIGFNVTFPFPNIPFKITFITGGIQLVLKPSILLISDLYHSIFDFMLRILLVRFLWSISCICSGVNVFTSFIVKSPPLFAQYTYKLDKHANRFINVSIVAVDVGILYTSVIMNESTNRNKSPSHLTFIKNAIMNKSWSF